MGFLLNLKRLHDDTIIGRIKDELSAIDRMPAEASKVAHHYTAFWCFHNQCQSYWIYFGQVNINSLKSTPRELLWSPTHETASVWCDGISVITRATDLPHEIEAKCQSVYQLVDPSKPRNQIASRTIPKQKSGGKIVTLIDE